MKKKYYLLLGGGFTVFLLLGSAYLLKPNRSYLNHVAYIANLDSGYCLIQHKQSHESLLKQKQELLPHLRSGYCRYHFDTAPEKKSFKRTAFLQQKSANLSKLLKDAAQTQSRLSCFLTEFAKNHPDSRLYIPAIKSMGTIQNLLESRWGADASMITDYSRATISFPTLESMYQGLEDLKESGLIILQITDNFATPCLGGYRDINVVFRDFANGHLGEIQCNIHTIMEFKNGLGTALFHVIRSLLSIPALENRPLSANEQLCLDWLFERERIGYDAALMKASN